MRGLLFFCLLCLSIYRVNGQAHTVSEIRNIYLEAVHNKKECERLLSILRAANDKDPLMLGFKGAGTIVSALHKTMPWDKLSAYSKGKSTLEHALSLAPQNVELRYLRLGIQSNLPKYLDYRADIARDSNFLRKELPGINDRELRLNINAYLRTLGKRKK